MSDSDPQAVSDPDDETTKPDVTIDLDAADPWGETPVSDPDLDAPAQDRRDESGDGPDGGGDESEH